MGLGNEVWVRDGNGASKDIAESPTALPERPKKTNDKRLMSKDFFLIHNAQCIIISSWFNGFSSYCKKNCCLLSVVC